MSRWFATVACALGMLLAARSPAAAQPGATAALPPEVAALYEQKPVIELVTMGVGGLIWERHGHIALCVRHENPRDDVCYNYGIGDFRNPLKMGWGFFRGTDSFWVGRQDPREMLAIYRHADRSIWVQPIPLTPEQKIHVINKLEFDVLEENKHYSYDHFWDNCTTRVRDILDNATDGALSKMTEKTDGRTYRDLAREGFHGLPSSWLALLITDMGMGRATDRVPSYFERMFLPDYMREAATARWGIAPITVYQRKGPPAIQDIKKALADGSVGGNGEGPVGAALSAEQRQALERELRAIEGESSGRLGFALLILLLTAPAWITRLVGKLQRVGLALAVIPGALLGLVFWALAVISPLPYVRWNESCLALMPFDLLLLVLPAGPRRLYARGRVIMLVGVAALMLVGVVTAPIWPLVLWGLIPNLVVGFVPEKQATPRPASGSEPRERTKTTR